MAVRFLQFAAWLTLVKWTARVAAVVLTLIAFAFCGFLVAALMRGLSLPDALLTAFIATILLIMAPAKWVASGKLPTIEF